MIKKFLIYTLLLVLSVGCSESFDIPPVNSIASDGSVQLTMDIPAPVATQTRATDPEFQVNYITMLIYNGESENTLPSQYETIYADISNEPITNRLHSLENNKLQLSFRLEEELKGNKDLRFYFLANYSSNDLKNMTESQLKSLSGEFIENGSLLVMSGKADYNDIFTQSSIPLYRNAAKVSVSNAVPTVDSYDIVFYPYSLYGYSSNCFLLSSIKEENNLMGAEPSQPEENNTNLTNNQTSYFYPTINMQNAKGIGGELYIITKATFNETEYFYRLDFVETASTEESQTKKYINAQPNHWYQFIILDITGPGYPTPAEAALHPENGIKYEIHDHSPVSYNMVSDGYRELGVSHITDYSGLANEGDNWSDQLLYIKFFSKDASETPTSPQDVKSLILIEDPAWLEISEAELITNSDLTGGTGSEEDSNDEGNVFGLKLRFKDTYDFGTLYNKITVKWKGLEREVPVVWNRKFNGSDVTSASLTMTYNGVTKIDDYWSFLSSTDDPEGTKEGALWGIQTEANNGKVRNEGFHFPVMYGSGSNLATYSYTLTFDKQDKFKKDNITKIEISQTGNLSVNCDETANSDYFAYSISLGNQDGYQYKTGEICFKIIFNDGSEETYSFDTYHTGFFHKDSQIHRVDGIHDSANYYYYEVVPVKIGSKTRYMLDRNLAAKSAQMYIRDAAGYTAIGNPEAAGGYYTVAYQEWESNHSAYKDPIMYDDTSDRVSPPGYRVPLKNAWDALRISSSFHSEGIGEFYPTYYISDNPDIGNVYFPKAMMYIVGSGIMGEVRSGYYWTGTAATGTEKDEIGKWLNMIVFSGNSSWYTNGCVDGTNSPAYGASVRCINDTEDNTVPSVTSFNVTGATHVFLYTEEDGIRTPTTSWPGHPIGNYDTMTDGRWFGFTYESTQFKPEELYVIFNFLAKDGKIYSYSQDNYGNTIRTSNLTPLECKGWKVVGDSSTAIIPTDGYSTDDVELMPAFTTALKNWWRCGVKSNNTPYVYDYQTAPPALYLVGDATAGKWDTNALTKITTTTRGIYSSEVYLSTGEFKASFNNGKDATYFWDDYFLRPTINNTIVSADGVTNNEMGEWKQTSQNDDYKWKVVNSGYYNITFDVNNMKFYAKYNMNLVPAGYKRIFVTNDLDWQNINLYWWTKDSNGNVIAQNGWPGTSMIRVPDTEKQWFLDIPADAQNVIFNYGGTQTGDIELKGNENSYDFILSEKM